MSKKFEGTISPEEKTESYFNIIEHETTKENDFYHKMATCVLTNCNTDYTPGGVHSHADGSPVKITMNLTFTEMDMITKQMVDELF